MTVTRRRLLAGGAGLAALAVRPAPATEMPPTLACDDGHGPTAAQTPGPFFTPMSPLKSDFRPDDPDGAPLTLHGVVWTRRCRAIAEAVIELWHADNAGRYDNRGYRLRGHQVSDGQGRFRFDTVVPGLYPGRTRHFHVRVAAAGGPVLTTQLYFPGERQNAADRLFDRDLQMDVQAVEGTVVAGFGFVLDRA